VRERAAGGGAADVPAGVVSLNGLPPGEPWIADFTLEPGVPLALGVDAVLVDPQPFDVRELVLERQALGSADYEEIGSTARLGAQGEVLGVPGEPATPSHRRILLEVRPNPFRAATALRFVLPAAARVEVEIHDVSGRLVRRIAAGSLPPGAGEIHWDGHDRGGRPAKSGIYAVRFRVTLAGGERIEANGKVVRLR
jgi:hypothetical protein